MKEPDELYKLGFKTFSSKINIQEHASQNPSDGIYPRKRRQNVTS
jgi:hypothetical protein